MENIGFFCENRMFSGGRYFSFFVALALVELGNKVTFITDTLPIFLENFKDYSGFNKIKFEINNHCEYFSREFTKVIGVPKRGGLNAFRYASMHRIPLYEIIFETPNFVKLYRNGTDSEEVYWYGYKDYLNYATKIITISKESKKYIQEWIGCKEDKVVVINPCINDNIADKVVEINKKDEITVVSRFLDFKHLTDVIEAVNKLNKRYKINFITSYRDHYGTDTLIKQTAQKHNIPIQIYENITDFKKFELIKNSKVLVHPSVFEGFGLPPAEALYCGTPAIVYDLPVYKDFFGDNLIYVEKGNVLQLSKEIELCFNERVLIPNERFLDGLRYKRLVNDMSNLFGDKINQSSIEISLRKIKGEFDITLEEF